MLKSIYLTGPHSSGKTTLAKALQSQLIQELSTPIPLVEEVARKVLRTGGFTANDLEGPRCLDLQMAILQAQFHAENLISGRFISDRCALDPIVYAFNYAPMSDDWTKLTSTNEWTLLLDRYRDKSKSIVILVKPNIKFMEADGVRFVTHDWDILRALGESFEERLTHFGIPFQIIPGEIMDIGERVSMVKNWISS